jgi:hypothetical protein
VTPARVKRKQTLTIYRDERSRLQYKTTSNASGHAFYRQMKKNNGQVSRERRAMNYATVALEQMELYCVAHPGSPSAVRRPGLFVRGELWIALLGPSVEEGIVGIGPTIAAALRAFDTQYLAGLRPAVEHASNVSKLDRPAKAFGGGRGSNQNAKADPRGRTDASGFVWPS